MKKISGIALLAGFIALTSSCRKERMDDGLVSTKTIYVEMNANDSYSTVISHAGDADDVMHITKQAANYSTSRVIPVANGNVVFEYKPALDFIGSDEVQISNEEGSHGNAGQGNCGKGKHHHDDVVVTIFKINIKGASTKTRN